MNRTAIVCMIVILAIPRVARSQPADAGVDDAAPPRDADVSPDAPTPPTPPPTPSHDTRPKIVSQQPPIYPDAATMQRLYTITAQDQKTLRLANRLWTRVKTGK